MHLTYICINFNTTSQLLAATYGEAATSLACRAGLAAGWGRWPGLGALPAQPQPMLP